MSFSGMFVSIIFIFLASIVVDSYGKLLMTYRPSISAHLISLTCESEDDRAALIWNNDLHSSSEPKAFSTIWPKTTPKCAIVAPGSCITEWKESNAWSIVNSSHHPMGPVFDSRWEDFEEYPLSSNFHTYCDYMYVNNVTDSNAMVFSIRGTGDIHVQLCETGNIPSESSLNISSTRDSFTKTRIRTCPTKPSKFSLFFRQLQHSDHEDESHPEYLIDTSDDEWRTFVLRWNTRRTGFRLYNTAKSYAKEYFTDWPVTDVPYSKNGFQGRVRFHTYKYFMTTVANTVLSTLEFKHEEESFCIQLLVSLCSECNLIVRIAYKTGDTQLIGQIFGYKNELYAELPTWKAVNFSATLLGNYTDPIRLEIVTNCSKSVGGRWAIDSFRKCIPNKPVRSVSSVEESTSNIQCQELWYGDNSLVNSNDEAVRNILNMLLHKPPSVRFINSTTAIVSHALILDEKIWSTLRFEIKTEKTDWTLIPSESRYDHHREIPISNLSREMLYSVRVVVTLKGRNYVIIVKSIDINFTTKDHRIRIAPPTIPTVDEVSSKQNLIWLTSLPMLMICALLILVLYRKRQYFWAHLNSLPWIHNNDVTPLSPNEMSADVEQVDDCTRLEEIKKFEDYVKKAVANGELRYQFEMLPRGMKRPCIHGSLLNNKSKNRYENLIAYDETRVILGEGSLGCESSYINANYIQGYCKEKAYIATQGPKSNTILDFWRMIWQEEVRIICMLVNVVEDGKKMCEQYWPEIGKTVEYGHIVILTLNQSVYANYTYRTFQLTTRCEIRSRTVRHLQYTGWPAEGVPMYSDSIVEYLNELRAIPPGPGPIVVHCTAGTGRTGTIILCDICLRYTAAEGMVDPFVEAKKMYDARPNMLDNLQQYILAHLMPTQCLFLPSTKLPCSDVTPERMEALKKALPCHIKSLVSSSWKDRALRPIEPRKFPNPKHLAKLRFPKLIPAEHSVVTLKRYPQHDKYSDYINAVSVDGVRVKKQYIASQLPLPTTLSDYWRLVAENKIELIIILQRPSPEDLTCIDLIPSEIRPLIIPVPYIKVEHKSSNYREFFSVDELLLTDSSEDEARTQNVTVITCNNWRLIDNSEPPPPEALVSLWSASERISRAEAPTLVLCRDGVMACGLYLALSFLLEKMIVEQEFDVILAVRAIRRSRTQFVNSKMQFEYLCDAAVKFLEDFDTYANFV